MNKECSPPDHLTPFSSVPPREGDPTMRLAVLDKDEARQEERQARNDARALQALAAQQAAAYEFAAALDEAQNAASAPAAAPTPTTASAPAGGGGGGGGGGGFN